MTSPHCMKTHTRIPKSVKKAPIMKKPTGMNFALFPITVAQCFTSSFVLSSFTMMQNMTVAVVDMNSAIVPAHWLMTNVCFTSACTSSGTL